jgi:hypothetical protein
MLTGMVNSLKMQPTKIFFSMISLLQELTTATLEIIMKPVLFAIAFQMALTSATFAKDQNMPTAPVQELNLSLDAMSLTTKEISKRDKLLKPIYENYETVNLSSVANALETAYGMNIYHHMEGKDLDLKNKKNVMENAVRYFVGGESLFNQAAEGVLAYKNSVNVKKVDNYYSTSEFNPLSVKLIEGNPKKWNETSTMKSPSLLASYSEKNAIRDAIFNSKVGTREALYTSTQNRLFTAPVMSDFLEAMKNLNLKAIDATVTFVNGSVKEAGYDKPYKVVYPTFSKIAPIPQPVIFISSNATYSDLTQLLTEHAPKIFAYNKLFMANLLPSVNEINDLLIKYPNIIKEVEMKAGKVSRANMINAVQSAFLNVTYGTGVLLAAPVGLAAMAASAVFSPIFITMIVVVL